MTCSLKQIDKLLLHKKKNHTSPSRWDDSNEIFGSTYAGILLVNSTMNCENDRVPLVSRDNSLPSIRPISLHAYKRFNRTERFIMKSSTDAQWLSHIDWETVYLLLPVKYNKTY